ncbi:MAG: hypothetical protein IPJ47_22405 [Anaerolineales bacterium]|nr:hypothetical protein [Anaerolineales bacterium]
MLIIISDLHLGDGTTADSIAPSAFKLFARRLSETAHFASIRKDGKYRPIERMDVILLGDIIDPLHSTRWLDTDPGDKEYIRPWSDHSSPAYAKKLLDVTRAILNKNEESLQVMRRLATGEEIQLVPASRKGEPDYESRIRLPLKVHFHYMVGNHDWYYHLKGPAFDAIRAEMIRRMGLSNPLNTPFPFEAEESPEIAELFERHKVYARHGDIYDRFNYDRTIGRDHGTLGDVFTMDVCNRYPVEVSKRYRDRLPTGIVNSLRKITNVRPLLATPLWISGQIRQFAGNRKLENDLKKVWDEIADEFLQLDFVRQADKAFRFDMVDAMEWAVKLSGNASVKTINEVVVWVHKKMWGGKNSFSRYALEESAFKTGKAQYIAYGHTHGYEVVPLALNTSTPVPESQIYFNSGTWHSYYDLAVGSPEKQNFIPYQTLTYLTFYSPEEHDGRQFEAWSGSYA